MFKIGAYTAELNITVEPTTLRSIMSITRNEFNALHAYVRKPGLTQRELAAAMGCSLGTANSTAKAVAARGLVQDGTVTEAGLAELEPYKVDNAILMAAGLSSRFAPISYEKPKGLLKVRDEVLVERQIRQLQEAGINDIYLVVGYKKEFFFYLEEQMGVHIVVNPEFAQRNNNSTLMRVIDKLGNSFICSSDVYFTENPFERYVWKSYYAAQCAETDTAEWCMTTGAKDRIENVEVGGPAGSWYMIGQAYFDRTFSQRFAQILVDEYDDPRTADKLWETIYIEHINELDMEMRRYENGTIFEFDSLDELREFDPLFLENLDSEIFDHIVDVLGCTKREIHDVYPLKQGLTNLSCHFCTNEGEYVYRHPGVGTENMIDREAEVAAQQLAKRLGIDDTFIYEDPEHGWKISRFIPNCRQLDPHDDAQLARAMEFAVKLHNEGVSLSRSFDYLQEGLKYEQLLLEKGPVEIPDYAHMREQAIAVRKLAAEDGLAHTCLTHNDFFYLNLLLDEQDNLYLIDWEYAGMADFASDFGTFTVTCELSLEEADRALEHYYGRPATPEERRHNFAFVGLAGWCWYIWSLQKESEGDNVGDWLYIYYNYGKKYLAKTLELYGVA